MSTHPESEIAQLAHAHNGVFTSTWWTDAGLSHDQLRRRVRDGRITRLHPKVFKFASTPASWEQQATAAVLACHQPAAASHVTAAFLWGLVYFGGRPPREIEVVTRRWRREHRDFVVHESTDLVEEHITLHQGIPITIPARTVIDLGATAPRLVGGALDTMLRTEGTTLRDVLGVLQQVARKGRSGAGVIRPHIADQIMMSKSNESYLEGLFERGLMERSVEPPELQVPVLRRDNSVITRLDFAYTDVQLGIALDGVAHHESTHRFRLDRAQQNELELLGWMVLRYTWWDVTGAMNRTARQVAQALQQRRSTVLA